MEHIKRCRIQFEEAPAGQTLDLLKIMMAAGNIPLNKQKSTNPQRALKTEQINRVKQKSLPYSRISTNKNRRNEGGRKFSFGNDSINYFRPRRSINVQTGR